MTPIALTPVLVTQSDARLVALAQQGHERAFEVLVRRYRPQLLAHCRRILSADAAEDALQHGLIGAWLALQNGSEVRMVRAWLHRVVHNAALRARAAAGPDAIVADDQLAVEGPEGQIERRHDLREALSALAMLPEHQREALLLTAVDGESYDDAAEWLGVSPTSLRGLVSRARAALRAAASAVLPPPLLGWLLGRARHGGHPLASGAAGAPAAGGMVVKGGALLLAIGAAAGGVAHVAFPGRPPSHASHAAWARTRPQPNTAGVQGSRAPVASVARLTPLLRQRPGDAHARQGVRIKSLARPPRSGNVVRGISSSSVPISSVPAAPAASAPPTTSSPPAGTGGHATGRGSASVGGSTSTPPTGSTTSGGSGGSRDGGGGGDAGSGTSPTPATSGGQGSDGGSSAAHDSQSAGGNGATTTGGDG